jgi:hypothetical protein
MSLNANAKPFKLSTECVIDMPHDVMLDYVFPYTIQMDYIKNESVHPLLGVPYQSLSKKTPSYTSYVLTRQSNGLCVPVYYNEVQPWSSILSTL